MEPLWRVGTRIERRFSDQAGVQCRGYSLPLQRVLTDFGADEPFGRVPSKVKEHYGIEGPVSAIQRITEHHAQCCYEQEQARTIQIESAGAGVFIGELDGSMVPVVETESEAPDRRRAKNVFWKEVRLCLVHPQGSTTPVFGGHFLGGVEESGRQLERCAARAGLGQNGDLHAVGDGAPWIADQVTLRFGTQGRYLLDFYHVCDYLAAASKVCAANDPEAWLDEQKLRLKVNQAEVVLEALAPFREADNVEDGAAPVRVCHRYLFNRLNHLDYQGAIERDLPIGSGEIESAHRYIVQARLKRPGAWWTPAHVQALLTLRLKRANGEWESYWQSIERKAA